MARSEQAGHYYLRTSVDASQVFMVHGDIVHITGIHSGYMRKRNTYSDYTLHVEWRYPGEQPATACVFIHLLTLPTPSANVH